MEPCADRKTQVREQLDLLGKAIEELEVVSGALIDRLEYVTDLATEVPQTGVPTVPMCPLATDIRLHRERVESVVVKVSDLLRRLEI